MSANVHPAAHSAMSCGHLLLDVPGEKRQVQNQRHPISVDQKQKGHKSVDGKLGKDVGVEAVAEVGRVDVIAAQTQQC